MPILQITTGFGEQLRDLRLQRQITQEVLARHLHVTRQTVSGWERGRSEPDIETLVRLAGYFDISLDALLSKGGVQMITIHYRKGGLIMLPFVTLGLILALLLHAPWMALCAIAAFGYIPALVLILLGKRTQSPKARGRRGEA